MSNVKTSIILPQKPKCILAADIGEVDSELLEFLEADWNDEELGTLLISQHSFRMVTSPMPFEQLNVCPFFDALDFFGKYAVTKEMPIDHRTQIFIQGDSFMEILVRDFISKYQSLCSKITPLSTAETVQRVGDYISFPSIRSTFSIGAVDVYAQFAAALVEFFEITPPEKKTYLWFIHAIKKLHIGYPDVTSRINTIHKGTQNATTESKSTVV